MDLFFDFKNNVGDHLKVALSNYNIEDLPTDNGGVYAHFIYHKKLKPQIKVISDIILLDK